MEHSNIAYAYTHSGVQDVKPNESSFVAITLEDTHKEAEDFDHLDELIMYLVSFLRRLRRTRMYSENDTL
ncbi:hypothetical protein JTE90_010411 [Oedothorax gibbosus]|uniref:Uncharacterized protein n=1 Tax=Oedothorax gibbosus TaxID=931172 RepID=A0AAV6W5C9_9ARAC|nr:hypothetical protein JTE90_010411 [Oedothorax gibbosus]